MRYAPICSIDGCDARHFSGGYCAKHRQRFHRRGDPNVVGASGRPLNGEHPSWYAIHKRLSRTKGPAARYACVDCGKTAREWSYNGMDAHELVALTHGWMLAYSLDLENYEPRCPSCHRLFDNAQRKKRSA